MELKVTRTIRYDVLDSECTTYCLSLNDFNIILSQFDITPLGDVPKCAIRHSREDITSVLDLTSDYVDRGRMNLF